jgi:hypothetical protein
MAARTATQGQKWHNKPAAETKQASRAQVQAAAEGWTDAVLECRSQGHAWEQNRAEWTVDKQYNHSFWNVWYDCIRGCGVEKREEWDKKGVVERKVMRYPRDENGNPTYLMEGLGRIMGENRGVLRLEQVNRLGWTEYVIEKEN